ncbi:MAG: hypothetical protein ACMZ64_10905 [Oleiphilus sp.]
MKSQKEFARANWSEFQAKTSESFKGATIIAFLFGLLAVFTSGVASQIFSSGIIEHIAKITLPFALCTGMFLTGVTGLLRGRCLKLCRFFRHLSNSCLILSINLISITSGLCFGLAIPGAISSGWQWFFIWPILGLCMYLFAVFCHYLIIINYEYIKRSSRRYIYLVMFVLLFLGLYGIFWSLESAAHDIVFAAYQKQYSTIE